MNLESKRPAGPLFRVGRDDDAWAVPDWAYSKEDRTFGNRFDDPAGVYRVLYASSQRLKFANYRKLVAHLQSRENRFTTISVTALNFSVFCSPSMVYFARPLVASIPSIAKDTMTMC
jgi:hypothetical protein